MDLKTVIHCLNAKKCGKGWVARCPTHDDRNPSLSIGVGKDGKLLLNCFAGCSFEEIIQTLETTYGYQNGNN